MTTILRSLHRFAPVSTYQIQGYRRMSNIKEIRIPVPWGHIAGRESGPADGKPLLLLHGWLDNCGTFDAIQQHLPSNYRCINIDLPGHGLSSHMPEGTNSYGMMQGPLYIRMVREHFGWDRFSIVGHSMGSGMGMLYASIFPEEVASLTILDLVKFLTRPADQHPQGARDAVLSYVELHKKMATNGRPQYPYEVLRKRLIDALNGDVDEASADALLVRGARRDPETGLYESTYDLRHRQRVLQWIDFPTWREYAIRLRCRLLVVLAEEGGTWIGPDEEAEAIKAYRQGVPDMRLERLPGGHHVHLTHPERLLPLLNDFLSAEEPAENGGSGVAVRSGL